MNADIGEGEHRYLSLAELSPDGIAVHTDGVIVFANSSMVRMLGANSAEDLIGLNSIDFVVPEGRQRVLDDRKRASHGETGVIDNVKLMRLDGTEIHLERSMEVVDWGGEPSYLVNFRDNSARQKAEEAQRISEARYALAIAGTNDGIWERNFVTGEIYRSPRWFQILDYEKDDVAPTLKDFENLLHPEDAKSCMNAMRKHLESDTPFDVEYRIRRRSGEYVWVSAKAQAEWDTDGKPVRIAGSIADISERKRAEENLKKSETRFRNFADAASDWFFEVDENFLCTWVSFDEHPISGAPSSSVIGYQAWGWPGIELQEAETAYSQMNQLAQGKEPFRNFIIHTKYPELGNYQISISAVPIFDEDGTFRGYRGSCTDITRQATAENLLHQSQKMETVGQLTGGVAHDFNNLLAAVMNNAQLLEFKLEGQPDLQHFASSIVRTAERGAELTHRLLAFSRNQTLQPKTIQLDVLCRGMNDLLKRSLGETIEIVLTPNDQTWDVLADPSQVESALLNLAINSSHAMETGGKLTITTENISVTRGEWAERWECQPGEYVALRVTDTGTGIPADVLDHVFEPFFSTKEVGQGSGLGLSMIYGFARQSGGFSTIESTEGEGTAVTIYLPRADQDQAVTKIHATNAELPEGRGETILLIEDDVAVRDSTTELLKVLGYMVLAAEDGTRALEILSSAQTIDLLLSDMVLPGGMNGIEIYQKIHQQRPDLKCLFISGYASLPGQTLPEGTELLAKPISMSELAGKIRRTLDA